MTPDLIDYLRDKLDHADDVVCTCPVADLSIAQDRSRGLWPTIKGWDEQCQIHGINGTERTNLRAALAHTMPPREVWRHLLPGLADPQESDGGDDDRT